MSALTARLPKLLWLRRHVLTLVFAVAYLILTAFVVEQGRIIDSQRYLIRQLFRDSIELQQAKIRAVAEQHHASPQ